MRRHAGVLWIPTLLAVLLGAAFLVNYEPDLPFADLRAKYANEASRFASVQGMRVHYRSEGSGPTLLLLHGAGSSLHTWDRWLESLKYDFRVIRIDLPGHGLTGPMPSSDYRVGAYVEFLEAFISELGNEPLALAGQGFGGQVAWNYALRFPARVDKLILLSASGYPRPSAEPAPLSGIARIPGVRWLASVMTTRSQTADALRASFGDEGFVTDALVDRHHELARRPGNRQAAMQRAAAAADDLNGDHRQIQQPTLILWGMQDRRAPLTDARGFADDVDGARLITYPGIGHLLHEELPGQSARAALTFLRDR